MTQWDFAADLQGVLDQAERGEGPRSMSQMIQTAAAVVENTGQQALHRWLVGNAETLLGQQILVTSVHAQASAATELPLLLRQWAGRARKPTAAAALDWLKEEHPALLRAWLLSRVEDLLDDELRAM